MPLPAAFEAKKDWILCQIGFLGRRAKVDAHATVGGRRHVEGVIRGAGADEVTLVLDDGATWTVPLAAVKSARLVADPWSGRRPSGGGQGSAGRVRRAREARRGG